MGIYCKKIRVYFICGGKFPSMPRLIPVNLALDIIHLLHSNEIHQFYGWTGFFIQYKKIRTPALFKSCRRNFIQVSRFLQLLKINHKLLISGSGFVRIQNRQQALLLLVIIHSLLHPLYAFPVAGSSLLLFPRIHAA
ncbi:hypothetical protein D3C75_1033730 [compost metagenome]